MVRLGIGMYGLSPDRGSLGDATASFGLVPAMTLTSKLVQVKKAPKGSSVGYGGTAVLEEDTYIGVVMLGYADGIPRVATSAAGVSFGGVKAPLLGRVSMDQITVDLGLETTAKAGDYVTVFGEGGYSVDDWATASGTINYEVVTRVASRVPRVYTEDAEQ
jgi:alanine racemase